MIVMMFHCAEIKPMSSCYVSATPFDLILRHVDCFFPAILQKLFSNIEWKAFLSCFREAIVVDTSATPSYFSLDLVILGLVI